MAYVAPIHRATSIRNALRVRLTPGEDSLVVAKSNRLEIWRVTREGMSLEYSTVVNGIITMVQRLQPKDSDSDLLFLASDRFEYFTAKWDSDAKRLHSVQVFNDGAEEYMRESQSQNRCLVDPSGRFMTMLLWEGVINVMRLGQRKPVMNTLEWLEQVRITELFVKDATFIPTETGHPKIAFLHQMSSNVESSQLSIYRLTSDDSNATSSKFDPTRGDREWFKDIPDKFARMLIPVSIVEEEEKKRYHYRNTESSKARLGGLIVVGETLLVYVDSLTKTFVESVLSKAQIFVAWAEYDVRNYFLADDYGTLHLLTIATDGVVVTGLRVKPLGTTSRASTLVYMGDNMIFVGSHHGDSQLVWYDSDNQRLELVQTLASIAPIMDFTIMDMGNREGDPSLGNEFSSGQARIVAGCGAFGGGSLRSVRSAVHLEDIGILDDFADVRAIFSLSASGSDKHEALAVSFITETRVFKFDLDGSIEELSAYQGLILNQTTLLTRTLPRGRLLQITPKSVNLLDSDDVVTLACWQPPEGTSITSASANDRWALIAAGGTTIVTLNLLGDLEAKQHLSGKDNQISCVHVSPQLQDVGVVGFWETGSISIIDLPTLKPLHSEELRQTEDSSSTPREIVLAQLHPPQQLGPTLLIAMDDGSVVTFDVSRDGYTLSGRKSVILGRQHAHLHVLPRTGQGTCNIFATTEQSSLIYSDHGRIVYSAALADNANCVVPFDSEAYPDAIVLSSEKQIRIAHVDTERRAHIKPLDMGETIRRISYSPKLRLFALGCIKKELHNNEELVTSSIKLAEEIAFDSVGKPFPLNGSSAEIVETVVRAQLPDSSGQPEERFLVGTSFLEDPDEDAQDVGGGRILILGVDSNKNLYQLRAHKLYGACRVLRVMDGDKIVAALGASVAVYRYTENFSSSAQLAVLAKYPVATFPTDMDIDGNIICVTDLMHSVTVLEFTPPRGDIKGQLKERGRRVSSAWSTAVSSVPDGWLAREGTDAEEARPKGLEWLQADAQGNLTVLRRNPLAPAANLSQELEVAGAYNLGEQVNVIRKLNIRASDGAVIVPEAFIGTVEGSLYVYARINPDYHALLATFQARLAEALESDCVGPTSPLLWRASSTARIEGVEGPFRFIDGELLERFLDLREVQQETICDGLGRDVESMRNLMEELRRMH